MAGCWCSFRFVLLVVCSCYADPQPNWRFLPYNNHHPQVSASNQQWPQPQTSQRPEPGRLQPQTSQRTEHERPQPQTPLRPKLQWPEQQIPQRPNYQWPEEQIPQRQKPQWPQPEPPPKPEPQWPLQLFPKIPKPQWPEQQIPKKPEPQWPLQTIPQKPEPQWQEQQIPKKPKPQWSEQQIPKKPESQWPEQQIPKKPEPQWSEQQIPKKPESQWSEQQIPKKPEPQWSEQQIPKKPESQWSEQQIPKKSETQWSEQHIPKKPEPQWPKQQFPKTPEPQLSEQQIPKKPEPQWPKQQFPKKPEPQWLEQQIPKKPEPQWQEQQIPKKPEPQWSEQQIPKKPEPQWPLRPIPHKPEHQWPEKQIPQKPESHRPLKPIPQRPEPQWPLEPTLQSQNPQWPEQQIPQRPAQQRPQQQIPQSPEHQRPLPQTPKRLEPYWPEPQWPKKQTPQRPDLLWPKPQNHQKQDVNKTLDQQCQVEAKNRVQCGTPKITQARCKSIECCHNGQQCYYGKAVTVQCTKDGQFVVVVARDTTWPRIDIESISLLGGGDSPCSPVGITSTFAIYQFPVTACGTILKEESGYMVYENRMESSYEVLVGPRGSITRDSHFELVFQCKYSTNAIEALVIEVNPAAAPVLIAALGPLRVELRLANGACDTKGCKNESRAFTSYYSQEDYPVTKVLRQPVYVEVRLLQRKDPTLVIMLDHCWATSAPSAVSMPQWELVVKECSYPNDKYLTTMVPVEHSSGLLYPTHYKRFILEMFTFVDQDLAPQKDRMFIHCSTSVCHPTPGYTCQPICNMQRSDVAAVRKTTRQNTMASSGEVILIDKKPVYLSVR